MARGASSGTVRGGRREGLLLDVRRPAEGDENSPHEVPAQAPPKCCMPAQATSRPSSRRPFLLRRHRTGRCGTYAPCGSEQQTCPGPDRAPPLAAAGHSRSCASPADRYPCPHASRSQPSPRPKSVSLSDVTSSGQEWFEGEDAAASGTLEQRVSDDDGTREYAVPRPYSLRSSLPGLGVSRKPRHCQDVVVVTDLRHHGGESFIALTNSAHVLQIVRSDSPRTPATRKSGWRAAQVQDDCHYTAGGAIDAVVGQVRGASVGCQAM